MRKSMFALLYGALAAVMLMTSFYARSEGASIPDNASEHNLQPANGPAEPAKPAMQQIPVDDFMGMLRLFGGTPVSDYSGS